MKEYKEFAKHILDEILFIEKEINLLTFDDFIKNEILKREINKYKMKNLSLRDFFY